MAKTPTLTRYEAFNEQQPNFSKVGDVVQSVLTEAQFQSVRDATWVLMDGRNVSGSDFHTITGLINIPDGRGQFLRGKVNINTVTGSGSASSNNATFTAHGLNRTGFKVRLQSGVLSGLSSNTDYYVIVIDQDTLAFASSLANALSNTKISISGGNSAVLIQQEDAEGDRNLGTNQEDSMQGHDHLRHNNNAVTGPYFASNTANGGLGPNPSNLISDGVSGNPRITTETRPRNVAMNFFIKINN